MTKLISRKLVTLLLLSSLFILQACNKEDDDISTPKNKYLTGVIKEKRFTKAEIIDIIKSVLPGTDIANTPIVNLISEVDVAAITYTTTGVDGKKIEASGIIAMCAGTKEYENLLSIQHYTIDMAEAPSRLLFPYEIAPVMLKRVVVMADYIGYGVSQTPTRQHPYLHIATTGSTCVDMIEAAREYLQEKGIKEKSERVELMGFSQGGTSTVATVLEMEKRGIASRIIKAHVGGGVYDLVGTLNQFIEAGSHQYPRTGYIPYIIRGMEYGEQLVLNQNKIYAPRIIEENILRTFETKELSQWHEELGEDITKVFHSDFYAPKYNNNADIAKLVAAFEKNSLINETPPTTPITLYHSKTDDFVYYSNAEAAHAKWKNSTLVELSSTGHIASGVEFLLRFMGLWEILNKSTVESSSAK